MMIKKRLSPIEAFLALPDEEKERQFKEFDRPFIADTFKPLTAAQRKVWEKAKARGRRRAGDEAKANGDKRNGAKGKGVKVISLRVEKGLLARADGAAKSRGISREELFKGFLVSPI